MKGNDRGRKDWRGDIPYYLDFSSHPFIFDPNQLLIYYHVLYQHQKSQNQSLYKLTQYMKA